MDRVIAAEAGKDRPAAKTPSAIRFTRAISMKCFVTADDMADMVLFLAGPAAARKYQRTGPPRRRPYISRSIGEVTHMDFSHFPKSRRMLVDMARSFVENELYPHEDESRAHRATCAPNSIEEIKKPRPSRPGSMPPTCRKNCRRRRSRHGLLGAAWKRNWGRANYALHWTCVARPSNILHGLHPVNRRTSYLYPTVITGREDLTASP